LASKNSSIKKIEKAIDKAGEDISRKILKANKSKKKLSKTSTNQKDSTNKNRVKKALK
jgi:F0F1-type ATP synthase membrane subunit b/b'